MDGGSGHGEAGRGWLSGWSTCLGVRNWSGTSRIERTPDSGCNGWDPLRRDEAKRTDRSGGREAGTDQMDNQMHSCLGTYLE